jgi:hypothetical protein
MHAVTLHDAVVLAMSVIWSNLSRLVLALTQRQHQIVLYASASQQCALY